MITILRGPAGAGKSTCLYRTVLQLSEKDRNKNHILCVPEQFTLSAMKLIMEMSSEQGMLNIDILSFNRLSYRIFQDAGAGSYELLDDTAKNLIIRNIASKRKDELKIFGANLRKQGYVSSVKSAISEFMQYGCTLADIDRMTELSEKAEPYLALKLKDIRIIYEEFLEKLGTDHTTAEEIYNAAAEMVPKAGFLKNANIYFDGFTGFTPVQYNLISGLISVADDIYVTVTDDDSDLSMFDTGIKTMERFTALSRKNISIIDVNDGAIVRHKENPAFEFLGKNLFRRSKEKYEDEGKIRFICAGDIESEVRNVLYHIKKLSVSENIRYGQMAMILGNMEAYSDILKKEAKRQGIPVYVDETKGIEYNPFTQLIRSALRCVADDMTYESVFNFLRTGMTSCDTLDIDLAENYVRALKIRGMKNYRREFVKTYRGIDPEMTAAANRIRQKAVDILEPLWEIRNGADVREYTLRLYEIGKSLDIKGQLDRASEGFKKENDEERALEFRQVYPLIMQLYDRMVELLGNEKMDLEEYMGVIDAGLSEIKIGTLPTVNDCIMAGDLTRSRFNDIKVLFVLGLSEQNIPGAYEKGGIISDSDRNFLRKNEVELSPSVTENVDLCAFYFYMNILKPSDKLFLSYALSSGDSGNNRQSFFMKEVMRLFSGAKMEEAKEEDEDLIFNRTDALIRLSETIGEERNGVKNTGAEELYNVLRDEAQTEQILEAAFFEEAPCLSEAASEELFEMRNQESATELERFAECAYSHYLRYGLGLKERLEFEFDASDYGSMLHDFLKYYSAGLKDRGMSFAKVTDEVSEEIFDKAIEESSSEKTENLFMSSGRNAYMKKRILRIAKRTVDTLRYQAGRGEFIPSEFEKRFSYDGLKGYIDRIDRYEDETGIYLNIIDYKSGNKTFDRDRVYWGLDLQLVIYMSAAMDLEVKSGAASDKVHPAGLFYYHIDDPVIEGEGVSSDEEILSKIRNELKLRGIVNSDGKIPQLFDGKFETAGKSDIIPVKRKTDGNFDANSRVADEEELLQMMEHTKELAKKFRDDIKEGYIEKNPFELNGKNACDHCSFTAICSGGTKRKLKKT